MTRSQAKQVAACIRELVGAPEAVKEAEAAGVAFRAPNSTICTRRQ